MTSKQRAYLRGLAMNLQPLVQIGKNGISDSLIAQLDEILESRELVKISVLRNADFTAKDIINELAELTHSEPVQAVGAKITLYRVSKRKDIEHIVLPE